MATVAKTDLRTELRSASAKTLTKESDARRSMRDWSLLVPERDAPLSFAFFPFQEEWYSDEVATAREAIWMKSAQVGMSAYAWRWAARRSDQFGDRVIYFFPTDVHVREFGDTRIEPSIRSSDYLLRRISKEDVRQKGLKQIGNGYLSLRGLQSAVSVQSVDADAIVFDEYDLSDQGNLEQAERRISGAQAAGREPRLRRLGYPTLPGFGVHARYEASDQRVWLVTCPSCGVEQQILWENMRWRNPEMEDVLRPGKDVYDVRDDVEEAWRACGLCDASLEGAPLLTGRWVAQRPGPRRVIGYHVSRLIVPRTDLAQIVINSRATSPTAVELFYTLDLGLPYTSAESALTDEDLDRAKLDGLDEAPYEYPGPYLVTGGLDVASERDLSIRVSEHLPDGRRRALYIGEPVDFVEVMELMERYNIALLAVDSMPERRQAKALAATYPGRVALVRYDETRPDVDWKYDEKKNTASVNRTEAIDAMMDAIRHGQNVPLRNPPRNYHAQMKALKRRTEEDSKGRPRRVYVTTGTDGDDYAHAEVYDLVAAELWVQKQHVEGTLARAAGSQVADESVGFTRPRLDTGGEDGDYYPGFGKSRY